MIRFDYNVITGLAGWDFGNTGVIYNYYKDKKKYVIFTNGKKPIKLRQYIRDKAEKLSSISMGNYSEIRRIFIEAYNIEGVVAINMVYNKSVSKILDDYGK